MIDTHEIRKSEAIPRPAMERLCRVYHYLCELSKQQVYTISSRNLGDYLGVKPHSIRKDISFLGVPGTSGAGYDVKGLKSLIGEAFGLQQARTACLVGLDGIGSIFLKNALLLHEQIRIVLGFDTNINILETTVTDIPLYPAYEIEEIVRRYNIEIAVMTIHTDRSFEIIERLKKGGVRGIINFSSMSIQDDESCVVQNCDIPGVSLMLSAMLHARQ